MIHIPGLTFPVEEFLLEDVVELTRWNMAAPAPHTYRGNRHHLRIILFKHVGVCPPGIDLGIRTVALHGKKAFGRDATRDLRRRRRRRSTRSAGHVTSAHCKAGELVREADRAAGR